MTLLRGFCIGLLLLDAGIYAVIRQPGMTAVWLVLALAVYAEGRLTR